MEFIRTANMVDKSNGDPLTDGSTGYFLYDQSANLWWDQVAGEWGATKVSSPMSHVDDGNWVIIISPTLAAEKQYVEFSKDSANRHVPGAMRTVTLEMLRGVLNSQAADYDLEGSIGQQIERANIRGPGSELVTIKLLAGGNGAPIPGMSVWVTSDAQGLTTVAGVSETNDLGLVKFLLSPSTTYYLWGRREGFQDVVASQFLTGEPE